MTAEEKIQDFIRKDSEKMAAIIEKYPKQIPISVSGAVTMKRCVGRWREIRLSACAIDVTVEQIGFSLFPQGLLPDGTWGSSHNLQTKL